MTVAEFFSRLFEALTDTHPLHSMTVHFPVALSGVALLFVVLAGSTWGVVVVPGDPVGSYRLEQVETGEMPEKEPRLLPREIRVIRQWIEAGAPDNQCGASVAP
jgi:hypothetical protein